MTLLSAHYGQTAQFLNVEAGGTCKGLGAKSDPITFIEAKNV
jgi:hypothetical protein